MNRTKTRGVDVESLEIRRLLSGAKPEDRGKIRDMLEQSEALPYAWSQAERHACEGAVSETRPSGARRRRHRSAPAA